MSLRGKFSKFEKKIPSLGYNFILGHACSALPNSRNILLTGGKRQVEIFDIKYDFIQELKTCKIFTFK